ncbi:hypothetical protein BG015_008902 [Linnemannia schmuckeri]|uniref:Carbohydrate-binding module family 96 domain-containing protein n=1 Tax=Linnemannia schmuckeri TaxID=64567 RepID=A0A9P5VA72_9FUNG|nr:hypothetical protein BG015_008902 [Linnemannia schmuckeri]
MYLFGRPQLVSVLAILGSIITVSQANEISRPAKKDSTIFRSTVNCPSCPESNCYKCTLGHENTLQANTGGLAYLRALVGFQLPIPSSSVMNCAVQFPAFTQPLQFPVNLTIALAASSNWDESTVNGENAPDSGDPFTMVEIPANTNMGPIDITPACKSAASDGEFSIYLGTKAGRIEVWSKDSGNPAILHVIDV